MTDRPKVDVTLLPKQYDFIGATEREVLFSGGVGSGKSTALAWKLTIRASIKGAREGLVRKHLEDLKKSTLKTLLEGDGDQPPVLQPGTYTHNKTEKTISIHGGGEILYFGLGEEDAAKIGSINLTGCAIEESAELNEKEYSAIRQRCRVPVTGLSNQIYSATNPRHPTHHLANRFGLAGGQAVEGCRAIRVSTFENRFLPEAYTGDMRTLTGGEKQRRVEGLWVDSDSLVYSNFHPEVHVARRTDDWKRFLVTVDPGFTCPAAILRIGLDHDDRAHVIAESYAVGQLETWIVEEVRRLGSGAEAVIYDSAAASLGAALRNAGFPAVAAAKESGSVAAGINKVRARLAVAGDGKPRLTVDPSCSNLIREFLSYEFIEGTDNPLKAHDHALDSLRYGISYVDRGTASFVGFVGVNGNAGTKEVGAEGTKESLNEFYARIQADPARYFKPSTTRRRSYRGGY